MVASKIQTYILIPGRSSTYHSYSTTESGTDAKFYIAIPADYIDTIQKYLELASEGSLARSESSNQERKQLTYLCPTVMLDSDILHLLSADVADMLMERALSTSKTEVQLHPSLNPKRSIMLDIPEDLMNRVYEENNHDTYFDLFYITYAYILLNKGLWTIVIEFQANEDRYSYTLLDGVAWIDLS
jgi:hypothetical protein